MTELKHYGVKGMKWGVRKDRPSGKIRLSKSKFSDEKEEARFKKAKEEWTKKYNKHQNMKKELDKIEKEQDAVSEQMRKLPFASLENEELAERWWNLDLKADAIADEMVSIYYDARAIAKDNEDLFRKGNFKDHEKKFESIYQSDDSSSFSYYGVKGMKWSVRKETKT